MTQPPEAARAVIAQWQLRADGDPAVSDGAFVLPVRTADREPAMLKIATPDRGTDHAHLVLRRWDGAGAVRLMRADPHRRALLLERLQPASLDALRDDDACEVVAGLYARLHVPAMPQLRSLATEVESWTAAFEALPRNAPIPHRLVEQAAAFSRDLVGNPCGPDVVLHGNLHHGHVLCADREPWVAVSPAPMNGDPNYELAPMLLHRWDERAGRIRDLVLARFYALVDGAGLDEERARAWVVVRVVHEAVRELARGADADLTKYVTLAKAVQG